jgi:hypothetical protein
LISLVFLVGFVLSTEVPVFHVDIVSSGVALVDLSGSHDLVHRILGKLVPMSHPAREARQSKENSEELWRNLQGLVNDARVEVHVRVELSGDEVIITQGDLLKLHGDIN